MLCDDIKPNLNISRLVIESVHTDIKITNSTKIMASFWDHYDSIFIDRVPYKYKNKPIFFSYGQSYLRESFGI